MSIYVTLYGYKPLYTHICIYTEVRKKVSFVTEEYIVTERTSQRNTEILLTPMLYSDSSASHISIILISSLFKGLNRIQTQQVANF